MSRNLKKDYLKKLLGIETRNGYKIDIVNYIYNPSLDNDYPGLVKVIEETDTEITKQRVTFFKGYGGTGIYQLETYTIPKNGDTWNICSQVKTKDIETSNRFNLNRLIAIAETL